MSKRRTEPQLPSSQQVAEDEVEILEVVGVDLDDDEESEEHEEIEEVVVSLEGERDSVATARLEADLLAERSRVDELTQELAAARSRFERDLDEQRKRATAGLIERLLPVIDNLERAVGVESDHSESLRDGVSITLRQLMQELRREGLEPIEAVGQPFDPRYHEAVETDDEADLPPDSVVLERRRGYLLGERLLRAALVRVRIDDSDGED